MAGPNNPEEPQNAEPHHSPEHPYLQDTQFKTVTRWAYQALMLIFEQPSLVISYNDLHQLSIVAHAWLDQVTRHGIDELELPTAYTDPLLERLFSQATNNTLLADLIRFKEKSLGSLSVGQPIVIRSRHHASRSKHQRWTLTDMEEYLSSSQPR